MLRAIIFDCDGVIADTEPLHFGAFQRVLAEEHITLTREEYYRDYLAFDDRGCFTKAWHGNGLRLSAEKLRELIQRKAEAVDRAMRTELEVFPGVVELIRNAASRYPLAVASGALRREVELVIKHAGVRECFAALVCAEDVSEGKPNPESFLKARSLLQNWRGEEITAAECLVIEDSIHGIHAARSAGMRCLAVTNSFPREKLLDADRIVDSMVGIELKSLEDIF